MSTNKSKRASSQKLIDNNQLILIKSEKFDIYSSAEKKSVVEVIYTTRSNNKLSYHVEIDFLPQTEKIYNYYINNTTDNDLFDFRAVFHPDAGIKIWDELEYGKSALQDSNLNVINEEGINLGDGVNKYNELAKYQNIINDFLASFHQESIIYDICIRNKSIYHYYINNNNQTASSFDKIGTFKYNVYAYGSILDNNEPLLKIHVLEKEYNKNENILVDIFILDLLQNQYKIQLNTCTNTIKARTKSTSINKNCIDALKQLCDYYKFKDANPLIANLLTKCINQANTNFKNMDKTITF